MPEAHGSSWLHLLRLRQKQTLKLSSEKTRFSLSFEELGSIRKGRKDIFLGGSYRHV